MSVAALTQLAQALDAAATAGRELSGAVAGHDYHAITESTETLSQCLLAVQRALPAAGPALAKASPDVRRQWSEHLAAVIKPVQVGAELSTINSASAAARLAALVRITGIDVEYSNSGQLSRYK